MVNMRASSLTPEGTSGSGVVDALAKIRVSMDELRRYNQTLEDDVLNIRQLQQETNPSEEMELLNS